MSSGPISGRWREPVIEDAAAFYARHPECRVDDVRLAELEPHIGWRVRQLERQAPPERREELAAALRLRIIEAATGYREVDARTGQPVHDYLAQANKYIAHHAAIKVYSELRRERQRQARTTRLAELNMSGPPEISDNPLPKPTPAALVDFPDLGERAEFADLASGIAVRLTAGQLRVFRLLVLGNSPAEVGHLLGIDRRTVHDHMRAIRQATRDFMAGKPAPLRQLATRRRKRGAAARRVAQRALRPAA